MKPTKLIKQVKISAAIRLNLSQLDHEHNLVEKVIVVDPTNEP